MDEKIDLENKIPRAGTRPGDIMHLRIIPTPAKVVQAHNNDQVGDDQPRGLCHVEARDSETLIRTETKSISNNS